MNESLKISLKKAGREWAAASGLLLVLTLAPLFADPVTVQPLVEKYLPMLPAFATAQVISFAARVALDQYRHRKDA